jgi:hypothetical protein
MNAKKSGLVGTRLGAMGRATIPFMQPAGHKSAADIDAMRETIVQEMLDVTLNRSKWAIIQHDGAVHYEAWVPDERKAPPAVGCVVAQNARARECTRAQVLTLTRCALRARCALRSSQSDGSVRLHLGGAQLAANPRSAPLVVDAAA